MVEDLAKPVSNSEDTMIESHEPDATLSPVVTSLYQTGVLGLFGAATLASIAVVLHRNESISYWLWADWGLGWLVVVVLVAAPGGFLTGVVFATVPSNRTYRLAQIIVAGWLLLSAHVALISQIAPSRLADAYDRMAEAHVGPNIKVQSFLYNPRT